MTSAPAASQRPFLIYIYMENLHVSRASGLKPASPETHRYVGYRTDSRSSLLTPSLAFEGLPFLYMVFRMHMPRRIPRPRHSTNPPWDPSMRSSAVPYRTLINDLVGLEALKSMSTLSEDCNNARSAAECLWQYGSVVSTSSDRNVRGPRRATGRLAAAALGQLTDSNISRLSSSYQRRRASKQVSPLA